MKSIEIDLDVNRAIEMGRSTFAESHNAILRRLLAIDAPVRATEARRPKPRLPRSSGAYSTFVAGAPIEANSLKELLRRVILVCAKRPGFLEALSEVATRRGRHIIAASPEGVYPQSPHLIEYAEKLDERWWFDTNIGRDQVAAYLKLIARLARLPDIPVISKRSEKTTLTLDDLGL